MADPRIRQLNIKAGIVKRCTKDKTSYEKEAETQRTKIEKLKADNQDEHVVRKAEECLQETLMMIPDCKRRLTKCLEELNSLLEGEKDLEGTQEWTKARDIANEAKQQLDN